MSEAATIRCRHFVACSVSHLLHALDLISWGENPSPANPPVQTSHFLVPFHSMAVNKLGSHMLRSCFLVPGRHHQIPRGLILGVIVNGSSELKKWIRHWYDMRLCSIVYVVSEQLPSPPVLLRIISLHCPPQHFRHCTLLNRPYHVVCRQDVGKGRPLRLP